MSDTRPPNPDLVLAWINSAKSPPKCITDPSRYSDAFEEVRDLCDEDPPAAWQFILAVLKADQSKQVMEMLAAGPLEDMLTKHPYEVIEWVETEARTNPAFATLLGGVWKNSIPNDTWQRVQAVWDRRGWDGIPTA